ncbi:MAG: iron-sulfur cluster assembly protein [Planctomycetes bacterium]|nr:iron-sulfur cluster assembly protein [Planctomycetota bacterium]
MTTTVSQKQILDTLSKVNDPELHRSLTDLNMVRKVEVREDVVEITLAITVPNCPFKGQIESDVRAAVRALPGVKEVIVHMGAMTEEERKALMGSPADGTAAQYNHIQRVVAVMSGKGGDLCQGVQLG